MNVYNRSYWLQDSLTLVPGLSLNRHWLVTDFCGSFAPHTGHICNIDCLVQGCSISIANALEILQSCTEPSICFPNSRYPLANYHDWKTKCCHDIHAVSANRILWVYAGFWWYHGILVVHLQDSVGALGAKWLTKWLHQAKAPPHRGVLRWEWGNKYVHLVTTFVFCHVSKCYFFSWSFVVKTCPQNAKVWYRSRRLNRISMSYLRNALKEFIINIR